MEMWFWQKEMAIFFTGFASSVYSA